MQQYCIFDYKRKPNDCVVCEVILHDLCCISGLPVIEVFSFYALVFNSSDL